MEKNIENWLLEVCKKSFGSNIIKIESLRESGSARRYYRIFLDSATAILCISENVRENKTFIKLSQYLFLNNINVPRIYSVDPDFKYYLLEDLGCDDFLMCLSGFDRNKYIHEYLDRILSELVSFQQLPYAEWKNIVEFSPLDEELISYDCNYSMNNYFSVCGKEYSKDRLLEEFERLKSRLLAYPRELWGLMFRDFQSRNIMIKGAPYFIDYQSSRLGPGIYDLVSFTWQAKANFSEEERALIIDLYIQSLKKKGIDAENSIKINLPYWAIFRILQTLGAYGLRGLKEGKKHFIESIPYALANLRRLLEAYKLKEEFPEIYQLIEV